MNFLEKSRGWGGGHEYPQKRKPPFGRPQGPWELRPPVQTTTRKFPKFHAQQGIPARKVQPSLDPPPPRPLQHVVPPMPGCPPWRDGRSRHTPHQMPYCRQESTTNETVRSHDPPGHHRRAGKSCATYPATVYSQRELVFADATVAETNSAPVGYTYLQVPPRKPRGP